MSGDALVAVSITFFGAAALVLGWIKALDWYEARHPAAVSPDNPPRHPHLRDRYREPSPVSPPEREPSL